MSDCTVDRDLEKVLQKALTGHIYYLGGVTVFKYSDKGATKIIVHAQHAAINIFIDSTGSVEEADYFVSLSLGFIGAHYTNALDTITSMHEQYSRDTKTCLRILKELDVIKGSK